MDHFLNHMLRLGDFAWGLRNHRLEQLLREPLSAAARVHRWLTAAEGSCPPPPPSPGKDFVASLRVVNGTLECPPQKDPHPYRDLPGSFSKHLPDDHRAQLHDRMGGPHSGRGVGAQMGPVVRRHARNGGPRTMVRRRPARGVGDDHPATANHDPRGGPRPPVGRSGRGMATGDPGATSGVVWGRVLAHPSAPPPPHRPPHRQRALSHRDTHMGTRRGHHPMPPPGGRSRPAHRGALKKWGACVRRRPVPAGRRSGAPAPHAPHQPCSRTAPRARQLQRAVGRVGGGRGRQPTGPPPPGRRG